MSLTVSVPALRAGSILVHIGPYKTGSTALQMAMAEDRERLAEAGVVYPGPKYRVMRPGWALLGRPAAGAEPVDIAVWDGFAAEVRAAAEEGSRVCVSTEDFASLTAEQVAKLVADLGRDRVHLLLVARRIDRLLPSGWQERVKSWNATRTYDEFLHDVLDEGSTASVATTFWRNHGVDSQLRRWTAVLPAEQITLIVADESDRTRTPVTVEALLGLPAGFLKTAPVENVSLAYDRIELIRRANVQAKELGLSPRLRRELLNFGLMYGLRDAPATPTDQSIPLLPRWAAERAASLGERRARHVEEAAARGVRVIGDPDLLRVDADAIAAPDAEVPSLLTLDTAAHAVTGVVAAAVRLEDAARKLNNKPNDRPNDGHNRRPAPAPGLDAYPGRQLLGEIGRRVRRRIPIVGRR